MLLRPFLPEHLRIAVAHKIENNLFSQASEPRPEQRKERWRPSVAQRLYFVAQKFNFLEKMPFYSFWSFHKSPVQHGD